MQISVKPVVAISSTIYDFQDLRSALKFWLEELGFQVSLSDFNDFPKDVSKNSYEACLDTIRKADYLILLIGSRNGGWYDEKERISITRMEYRVAYEQFRETGKPKPIVFVRQSLWDIREDRAALEKYLREIDEKQLTPSEKKAIAQHPSKFADNVDAVFSFLKEVGQVDEMKAAVSGKAPFPPANWIHKFNSFREIVDALRIAFGANASVELRQLTYNLKSELARNLSRLLERRKEKLFPRSDWGMFAVRALVGGASDHSEMRSDYVVWLGISQLLHSVIPKQLSTIFIEEAVRTGAYGQHEFITGEFRGTPLSDALAEIFDIIRRTQSTTPPTPAEVAKFVDTMHQYRKVGEVVRVPNLQIAVACNDAKTLDRLTDLCRRCIRSLSGDTKAFEGVLDWSASILPEETPKLAQEAIAPAEAEHWAMQ